MRIISKIRDDIKRTKRDLIVLETRLARLEEEESAALKEIMGEDA